MSEERYNVKGTFMRQTDKGVLVKIGDEEKWFPKSQCELTSGEAVEGSELEFTVPEWLAREKEVL